MGTTKEILEIRRRAGLKEAIERPEELAQRMADEESDRQWDINSAKEKKISADLAQKYTRAGISVEDIWADVNEKIGTIETHVSLLDSEVSIRDLANLSEVGAVTLDTIVTRHGDSIKLDTTIKIQASSEPPYLQPTLPTRTS